MLRWTPPQPWSFIPDVTPEKELTAQQLRNISQALQRLLAVANRDLRTVSLLTSQTDTMRTGDGTVVISAAGVAASFTFLSAVSMKTSIVAIVNKGANAVTIVPDAALPDVIDVTSVPAGSRYWYQSDGVGNWYRII